MLPGLPKVTLPPLPWLPEVTPDPARASRSDSPDLAWATRSESPNPVGANGQIGHYGLKSNTMVSNRTLWFTMVSTL